MSKELFEDLERQIKEVPKEDWNIETKCYLRGEIDALSSNRRLTEEEWRKLVDLIPLTKEEKERINW